MQSDMQQLLLYVSVADNKDYFFVLFYAILVVLNHSQYFSSSVTATMITDFFSLCPVKC